MGQTHVKDELPKAVFYSAVDGQKKRVRPRTRRRNKSENETETLCLTPIELNVNRSIVGTN